MDSYISKWCISLHEKIIVIPPAVIDLLSRIDAIYNILISRDFEYVHKFLRSLLDSGVISPEVYDELCLDLAELINSKDDFEQKAKKFAEKIGRVLHD